MDDHETSARFRALEVELTPDEREAWRVKQMQKSVAGQLQLKRERAEQGAWVPACGGTEVPFRTRTGRTLLYCWQPSTGRHAYIDCTTDLILSYEESQFALWGRND
jgi:hypothetical protein